MEIKYQEYLITDNKKLISPEMVKMLLDNSYWAPDRSIELIATTIENSICICVFYQDALIAFGRVVTDKSFFAWIADVVVSPPHRGKGLGKEIVQFIQDHPDIPDSLQLLRTKDTHGLYEKYGFSRNGDFMAKK
ncbi:MAG: GNAT family N-acetyltransferase [Chloroflexi bacterium]|nr:GNAT family N-acetyltransferase [Chloroflexota bacterium]